MRCRREGAGQRTSPRAHGPLVGARAHAVRADPASVKGGGDEATHCDHHGATATKALDRPPVERQADDLAALGAVAEAGLPGGRDRVGAARKLNAVLPRELRHAEEAAL